FLRGARCLLDYRDHSARLRASPFQPPQAAIGTWHAKLASGMKLDENDGMRLLHDVQLPANVGRIVESDAEARAAAREPGYPVVLKTAMRGIDHKSDQDGVRLDIKDEATLTAAYRDIAGRIGPRALVAPMVAVRGVEMLLGMINDAQFGPVVVMGAGGV